MMNDLIANPSNPEPVPQIRVRSNLRGGTVEACQKATTDWKTSYDKWYTSALKSGKLTPPKCATPY